MRYLKQFAITFAVGTALAYFGASAAMNVFNQAKPEQVSELTQKSDNDTSQNAYDLEAAPRKLDSDTVSYRTRPGGDEIQPFETSVNQLTNTQLRQQSENISKETEKAAGDMLSDNERMLLLITQQEQRIRSLEATVEQILGSQHVSSPAVIGDAEAPPTIASLEQQRQEEEIKVNDYFATLETQLDGEQVDVQWSDLQVNQLEQIMSAMAEGMGQRFSYNDISCKTSLCRVQILAADQAVVQSLELAMNIKTGELFPRSSIKVEAQDDGSVLLDYYLKRGDGSNSAASDDV